MDKPSKLTAYLLVAGVDIYWGLTQVLLKHALLYMNPAAYIALRFGTAGILFLFIFPKQLKKIDKKTWMQGLILGGLVAAKTLFLTWCLRYTSTSNSVFIGQLAILVVPAYYMIRYHQKPSHCYYIAVACMLIGLVIFADVIHTHLNAGDAMALISMAVTCVQTIVTAKYAEHSDILPLAISQIVIAGLLSSIVGVPFLPSVIWCRESILIIFLTGIIGSGLANTLRIIGQKKVHPTSVSLIDIIHPIFAMIGAAIIPNAYGIVEIIPAYKIIGSIIIIAGLVYYFRDLYTKSRSVNHLSVEEGNMTEEKFLWGSATAAYQCEGAWNEEGKGNSIWDDFCHSSENKTGITGDVSCDFYHHYKEDIKMMADSGQNTFRFSISWSRIVPHEDRKINVKGLSFYDRVLDECEKYSIVPNVTLVHYDLPDYIGKNGGWCYDQISDEFAYYASVVFKHYGNRIPLYVTINEPNHNAYCDYCVGNYPPNEKNNLQDYAHCIYNMVMCNAKAIREFRKLNLTSKIGIVQGCGPAMSLQHTPEYEDAVRHLDYFCNNCILDPAILGYYKPDFIAAVKEKNINLSFVKPGDLDIIKNNTIDFLGQNIYSRMLTKPNTSGITAFTVNNKGNNDGSASAARETRAIEGWFETDRDPNTKLNHWGREIYPHAAYDTLMARARVYGNIPIYVTENGHGMYESPEGGQIADEERISFLEQYIGWMLKAKEDGANVKGYYVWSSMDLYSWINGYKKRYGLVYVDYDDPLLKRTPKKSYYWYKDFIAGHKDI